jgi:hypothetical protein
MAIAKDNPGVIRADEAYTLMEFRRRCGLGQHAWRQLRNSGFRIVEIGRKRFVLGQDFIDYLKGISDDDSS